MNQTHLEYPKGFCRNETEIGAGDESSHHIPHSSTAKKNKKRAQAPLKPPSIPPTQIHIASCPSLIAIWRNSTPSTPQIQHKTPRSSYNLSKTRAKIPNSHKILVQNTTRPILDPSLESSKIDPTPASKIKAPQATTTESHMERLC